MRGEDKTRRADTPRTQTDTLKGVHSSKTSRSILPVREADLDDCLSFLLPREWACVPFSELFLRYSRNIPKHARDTQSAQSELSAQSAQFVQMQPHELFTLPVTERIFMLREQNGDKKPELRGLLSISRYGNVLHCISELCFRNSEWKTTLADFLRAQSVFSIFGEKSATIQLEKLCRGFFLRKHKFLFMKKELPDDGCARKEAAQDAESLQEPELSHGYTYNMKGNAPREQEHFRAEKIVRCWETDAEKLFPLQVAYEAEELRRKSRNEKEKAKVLRRLRYTLKTQTVLAYTGDDGAFLAKAGTNARGINWCQIGGVYTRPNIRGRGMAEFLIRALVKKLRGENKSAVLFVRPKNKAAIRAYEKAGFAHCGEFRIAMRLFR